MGGLALGAFMLTLSATRDDGPTISLMVVLGKVSRMNKAIAGVTINDAVGDVP
jgi:hypothetical protein